MRLLNTRTMQLKEFFNEEEQPHYAILSHTWATATDEVTLQDLNNYHENGSQHPHSVSIASRAGYRKIEACCHQALRDGYEWAWIDTCCLDKTSSAELSETINSMFSWYKGSAVCYAFLSDVDDAAEDISAPTSSFRKSRWFTRGWTLQELLAPRRVIFFSSGWQAIGLLTPSSKLAEVVSEITSIPPAFLEGLDLRKANLALRMSWASKRTTTRKEDIAYCLLGIFDVNMPLLYGEGMRAFTRLQEEIIKRTNDHTLLAWGLLPWDEGYSTSDTKPRGVLATSPADFANCGSLSLCGRYADYSTSNHYQMTNEGLQIELPLRSASISRPGTGTFDAILDCFCWRDPSRRIAISLKTTKRHWRDNHYNITAVRPGDICIRAGRSLWLSDVTPDNNPNRYKYFFQTILIKNDEISQPQFHYMLSAIDFPRQYRCDVKYVHPILKVEKNPHTGGPHSLRIMVQLEQDNEEEEQWAWNSVQRWTNGLINSWAYRHTLIWDQYTNILRGQHRFAQVRPQLDSILVSLQFTKEDHTLPSVDTTSFVAIVANIPIPYLKNSPHCRLAPLSEHHSPVLPTHPSGMSHGLVGHISLSLPNETLSVHAFKVPDSLNDLQPYTHFKIEMEQTALPQLKTQIWSKIRAYFHLFIWLWWCNAYTVLVVVLYGITVNVLASFTTQGHNLYVAIWALCFMPMLYQVRENDVGNRIQNKYNGYIVRMIIVVLSIAFSLFPALQHS